MSDKLVVAEAAARPATGVTGSRNAFVVSGFRGRSSVVRCNRKPCQIAGA
jgi:hypothetical protein